MQTGTIWVYLRRKKHKRVNFNFKIIKKYLNRLLLITVLVCAAIVVDNYFEKNPGVLEEFKTENETTDSGHEPVYLFSQTVSFNVKAPVQKSSVRNLPDQAHDKFLRKCHQMRNLHALKIKNITPVKPFYAASLYLLLNQQRFTGPDNEPSDC